MPLDILGVQRIPVLSQVATCDLPAAVAGGLRACVEHLSSDSDSFSLPAYRKWAKMMTHPKNKKGWPVLFKDRRGLYSTLRSAFESIQLDVGKGALRGLYAQFLDEAAHVVGNEGLHTVAVRYRSLAERWRLFAEASLPDSVPDFLETKKLLRQRYELLQAGGDAWQRSRAQTVALAGLSARLNIEFPLGDREVERLFFTLQDHLMNLYDGETAAVQALAKALE